MSKVFLLTGKPRIGKSTAIKTIINLLGSEMCGGFYTEEIRNTRDRIGFNCVTTSGESREIASISSESTLKIGRYGVEIEKFETLALPAIEHSLMSKKITVIDEIGFMQILSVPFQNLIHEIISSNQHVVVGTIALDNHPVTDNIKELHGVKIYTMTEENRDYIVGNVVRDILQSIN